MAYIVRMPKLGLEMERGTVLEWAVAEGEELSKEDLVLEVESEKSVGEVEARENGVLRRVYAEEGEEMPPGTPVGIVADEGEDIADLEAEAESELGGEAVEAESETESESEVEPEPAAADGNGTTATTGGSAGSSGDVKATPRAKKRAEEMDVDLSMIEGTGPMGAIDESDVEAAAAGGGTSGGEGQAGVEEISLSGMRRTIAKRLGQSYREAVHVTEHRTADAESLAAAAVAASEHLDSDISISDVLLRAISKTLAEHPGFNATFEEDVHRIHDTQNVCLAVDVEEGLVAPVIRDIESLSTTELADERRNLTERTLSGEYTSDDLRGGTFTITNLGVLGVESFDPVINPPQVAILGVNAIDERVVPVEGEPAIRKVLPLDLSFDHRVVDGADAARFLGSLVEYLEDPWELVEGVSPPETKGETLPEREVSARIEKGSGTITAGSFSYEFDLDEEFGGGEQPTPVDLFLGSFAACLSASIEVQGEIRDIEIESVTVDATASPPEGSVESIDLVVAIDTEADDETTERMIENGERTCHVAELLREDLFIELSWGRI